MVLRSFCASFKLNFSIQSNFYQLIGESLRPMDIFPHLWATRCIAQAFYAGTAPSWGMTEAGRIQKHPMVLLSTHVLAGVHTSGVLMLGAVLRFREGLKIQVSQKNKLGCTLFIKKGCRICLYLVDEDDILSSFSSMRGNFFLAHAEINS